MFMQHFSHLPTLVLGQVEHRAVFSDVKYVPLRKKG